MFLFWRSVIFSSVYQELSYWVQYLVVSLWFSKTVLFKFIQKCKEMKVKDWVQLWGEKVLDDVVEDSVLRLCDKVRLVLIFFSFFVKFELVKNLNFLITCIFFCKISETVPDFKAKANNSWKTVNLTKSLIVKMTCFHKY